MYVHSGVELRMHATSDVALHGVLLNDGTVGGDSALNSGVIYFDGSSLTYVGGTNKVQFDSVVMDNSSNVYINVELDVKSNLEFVSGEIISDRSDSNSVFVHFFDGATYTGAGNSSYVNGVVRKTGDDSFVFPVGNQGNLQPISISAPSVVSDHFTAFYRQDDAGNHGYSTNSWDSTCGGSPVVEYVGDNEYWFLDRTNGSSDVQVTLNYDAVSGVVMPSEVMVARWNGTKWVSQGNGGNTGSVTNGTVTSGTGCGTNGSASSVSSFGSFTLCASSLSALPVNLIQFNAEPYGDNQARLYWSTSMQYNHSHFEVERSIDGKNFYPIGTEYGDAFTEQVSEYMMIDPSPFMGLNYYRLKQVDLDGKYEFSPVRTVRFDYKIGRIAVFPNPTAGMLTVLVPAENKYQTITVFDALGKQVVSTLVAPGENTVGLDLSDMSRGVYVLTISGETFRVIKQ